MAFIRKEGKTKIMYFPVAASAGAVINGALMAWSGGVLIPATNTANGYDIAGVIRKTIATTDSDYAVARLVPIEVPVEKNVVWEAPVNVGTLATTSVGLYFDLDTADTGIGVDQSASTFDIVQCVKFISTSLGHFILNVGADSRLKANS
jgi:hypothetical protein